MSQPLIPPHDTEAEACVIGACMVSSEAAADALEGVSASEFYKEPHRYIFEAISEIAVSGGNVDLITVIDQLKKNKKLDVSGGPAYVSSLAGSAIFASRAGAYAKIIRNKAILRRIISAGMAMVDKAYGHVDNIDELIGNVEKELFDATGATQSTATSMRELAPRIVETVQRRQGKTGAVTGISTGFAEYDRMTTGLQPGELTIIAGRPSMGKTAFAVNIGTTVVKNGHPAAIYSLEMADVLLGERILAELGSVNAMGIRNGSLLDKDFERFIDTASQAAKLPLYIDDTPYITITDLRVKAARLHAKNKIEVLIVDYLQIMDGVGDKKREQEISGISRGLKGLARSLNIPVIALSQLNRGVEQRADKRPMLSDLRESGAIEQDADNIIFLYRNDYYRKDGVQDGKCSVIIAKQRNGPTGDFELDFEPHYSRFTDPGETKKINKPDGHRPWE